MDAAVASTNINVNHARGTRFFAKRTVSRCHAHIQTPRLEPRLLPKTQSASSTDADVDHETVLDALSALSAAADRDPLAWDASALVAAPVPADEPLFDPRTLLVANDTSNQPVHAISCVASCPRFIVFGTQTGEIGVASPLTGRVLRLLVVCPSAAVIVLRIDDTYDHVGYAAQDGTVGVVAIACPATIAHDDIVITLSDVYKTNDGRPVTCFAFEPTPAKPLHQSAIPRAKSDPTDPSSTTIHPATPLTRRFISAGRAGTVCLHSKGWLGYKVKVINTGKDAIAAGAVDEKEPAPIVALDWFGRYVVWITDLGDIIVYNMRKSIFVHKITLNPLFDNQMKSLFSTQLSLYPCSIFAITEMDFIVSWCGTVCGYRILAQRSSSMVSSGNTAIPTQTQSSTKPIAVNEQSVSSFSIGSALGFYGNKSQQVSRSASSTNIADKDVVPSATPASQPTSAENSMSLDSDATETTTSVEEPINTIPSPIEVVFTLEGEFIICDAAPFSNGHIIMITLDANPTSENTLHGTVPNLVLRVVRIVDGYTPICNLVPFERQPLDVESRLRPSNFFLGTNITVYQKFPQDFFDNIITASLSKDNSREVDGLLGGNMRSYIAPVNDTFLICSPYEIIDARVRDLYDHVEYLTKYHRYGEARAAVERASSVAGEEFAAYYSPLISSILESGQTHIQSLINAKKYDAAAQMCLNVLGTDAELWEKWISLFIALQRASDICPFIPTDEPCVLSEIIYNSILSSLLSADHLALKSVAETWPHSIYNSSKIAEDVDQKLEQEHDTLSEDDKQLLLCSAYEFNSAAGNWNRALDLSIKLHKGGYADLIGSYGIYEYAGKHLEDLIMEDIYQVEQSQVFKDLIRLNFPESAAIANEQTAAVLRLSQAINFNPSDPAYAKLIRTINKDNSDSDESSSASITKEILPELQTTLVNRIIAIGAIPGLSTPFLVRCQEIITMEYVRKRLYPKDEDGKKQDDITISGKDAARCYVIYLESTFYLDPSRIPTHEALRYVSLLIQYDPQRVSVLVRSPVCADRDYMAILALCKEHTEELAQAIVFLLTKTGKHIEALMLIVEKLGDVRMAIEFARDRDSKEIWDTLLEYAVKKPQFIVEMLNNLATYVAPDNIIRRIPPDLEIYGLKDALQKILHDYHTLFQLKDSGDRLVVMRSLSLFEKRMTMLQRGCVPKFRVGQGSVVLDGLTSKPLAPRRNRDIVYFINCGHCMSKDAFTNSSKILAKMKQTNAQVNEDIKTNESGSSTSSSWKNLSTKCIMCEFE